MVISLSRYSRYGLGSIAVVIFIENVVDPSYLKASFNLPS